MDISKKARDLLIQVGAVNENSHFVGTSGRHMSIYINKDSLLSHPIETEKVTKLIAQQHQHLDIDVVAAPVVGGVILGHWVAHHLSKLQKKEILSVYADKTDEGPLTFKRGYDALVKGKKILVIEDVVATGLSVHKMIDVVKKFDGKVKAMAVLVNRVPKEINAKTMGVPFSALCEIPAITYDEKDCPLCAEGVPINIKMGHGKKYLASKNKTSK